MLWVGGSIIVHGLEAFNLHSASHAIGSVAEVAAHAMPFIASAVKWTVETLLFGIIGLLIGGMLIPTIGGIAAHARKFAKGFWYKRGQ